MQRREVLRILAAGTALHLAPRSFFVTLAHARAVAAPDSSFRTLNAHQQDTVRIMAELILPRTDTPGATDVKTAEFIDLMLTDWLDAAERDAFLSGLADMDEHSNSLFTKDFVHCSPLQQGEILTALGEALLENPGGPMRRMRSARSAQPNFYAMFRRLTLTAYYTSEAGATQELHFEVIPAAYEGCSPASVQKEGVQTK